MNPLSLLAGFLSGALGAMGVGGGGILLLYLTAFAGTDVLKAQGVNLVFFLAAAAPALLIHEKNGFIRKKIALTFILSGVPGVFFGSFLAGFLPEKTLRIVFSLFLLVLGGKEFFGKSEKNS